MICNEISREKITAVLLVLAFSFAPLTHAGEKKAKFIFDPKKVEIENNWEEVNIGAIGFRHWCGESTLLFSGGGGISSYNLPDNSVKNFKLEGESWYLFYGCSPDGKYVFVKRTPIRNKGKGPVALEVYRTKTMQRVFHMPIHKNLTKVSNLIELSPDGKRLMWFEEGKIVLPDNYRVELVPVLREVHREFYSAEFSRDGKYIYILPFKKSRMLMEYNVASKNIRSIKLNLDGTGDAASVLAHPDGFRLFINVRHDYDEFGDNFFMSIYELELNKLDWAKLSITPHLFMEYAGMSGFSQAGDMLFTYSRLITPKIRPDDFYIMEKNGAAIKKVAKHPKGFSPKLSRNGDAIAFERAGPAIGQAVEIRLFVLKKEK